MLIPNWHFSLSDPKMMRWLPVLMDLSKLGWQAVPAARTNPELWTARYGKGLGCCIVLGNPTGKTVRAEVEIENGYLGKGSYLFSSYEGGKIRNLVAPGVTRVTVEIPARTPCVLRAVACVPASVNIAAEAGLFADGKTGCVTIEGLPAGIARRSEIYCPEKYHSTGRKEEGDVLSGRFVSNEWYSGWREVQEFPYVKENIPSCVIVVRDDAGERERLEAWRVQEYFRFYWKHGFGCANPVTIPITTAAQAPAAGAQVHILAGGNPPGATIPKGCDKQILIAEREGLLRLIVWGRDIYLLGEAVQDYLRVLDRKFPFVGKTDPNSIREESRRLRERAGILERIPE